MILDFLNQNTRSNCLQSSTQTKIVQSDLPACEVAKKRLFTQIPTGNFPLNECSYPLHQQEHLISSTTGVHQGCLLSPMIFIMVIDWIMRDVEDQGNTGIQRTPTTRLHDLDYANDICFLSQKLQHMQAKTNNLAQIGETTDLRVNKEKTKVMRTKRKQWDKVKLNGEDLEDVESFTYLGSIITVTGGTEEDVKCRIGKAGWAFKMLRPVYHSLISARLFTLS